MLALYSLSGATCVDFSATFWPRVFSFSRVTCRLEISSLPSPSRVEPCVLQSETLQSPLLHCSCTKTKFLDLFSPTSFFFPFLSVLASLFSIHQTLAASSVPSAFDIFKMWRTCENSVFIVPLWLIIQTPAFRSERLAIWRHLPTQSETDTL